ncbi:MAG: sugar phosphate isomerase/epimerase [Burkholderiaceae bacterium]
MGLGVSNLLWPPADDDRVGDALIADGIDRIDIAPSRYFEPVGAVDPVAAEAVRRRWADRGIAIVGLQALLHGTAHGAIVPALFGDDGSRAALVARLAERIDLAARLGARVLVLGAWPHRIRGALPTDEAIERAAATLAPLARQAADAGTCLAVEPIDSSYGNDFLVDHDQAATLVRRIDEPGFGLVLDVGCAGLVGEDLRAVLTRHGTLVRHIQLAEPALAPLDDEHGWHRYAGPIVSRFLDSLGQCGAPVPGVCIEALTPVGGDAVIAIRQSIAVARRWYS